MHVMAQRMKTGALRVVTGSEIRAPIRKPPLGFSDLAECGLSLHVPPRACSMRVVLAVQPLAAIAVKQPAGALVVHRGLSTELAWVVARRYMRPLRRPNYDQ